MGSELVERPDPLVMIQTAIEKGMDIDKLERLFELQRQHSKDMAEIAAGEAIRSFQAACPVVEKRREVHKKPKADGSQGDLLYRFADFDDVMDVAQPIMTRFGISANFSSRMDGKNLLVTCSIQVGTWTKDFSFPVPIPEILNANEAQKMGGALKYGMRSALVGALSIRVRGEDNNAQDLADTITAEEIAIIEDKISDIVNAKLPFDRPSFLKFMVVESVKEIPREKFSKAVGALDAKARAKK